MKPPVPAVMLPAVVKLPVVVSSSLLFPAPVFKIKLLSVIFENPVVHTTDPDERTILGPAVLVCV